MENECEALPGVAYPGVRDNRSTINTKTGYDDDDDVATPVLLQMALHSAVRLALIAEQMLFRLEHRLDHNECRLLVQDRSQLV